VGLNPNADGSSISNFQYLAADIDHDGRVRATDAMDILKMAVDHGSAPAQEWLFFSDEARSLAMTRKTIDWNAVQLDVTLNNDMELDLIGVLKGDVNGSWIESMI
ncbi:MAG: hypothetical protein HGA97_04655, partial [Chlorobiaceae bacterium]|nr:hypothetical protein [Chlorobiaceae bacterium]